jgi:hypothetical protein
VPTGYRSVQSKTHPEALRTLGGLVGGLSAFFQETRSSLARLTQTVPWCPAQFSPPRLNQPRSIQTSSIHQPAPDQHLELKVRVKSTPIINYLQVQGSPPAPSYPRGTLSSPKSFRWQNPPLTAGKPRLLTKTALQVLRLRP